MGRLRQLISRRKSAGCHNMLFSIFLFAVIAPAAISGGNSYKKIGCFRKNEEIFKHLLITDLDPTHHNWGQEIDWSDFQGSLRSLASRCQAKAEGKYKYF